MPGSATATCISSKGSIPIRCPSCSRVENEKFIELAGSTSNGDLATSVGEPTENSDAGKKFLADYKAAAYAEPAAAYGGYSYDAANAIINGLKTSLADAEDAVAAADLGQVLAQQRRGFGIVWNCLLLAVPLDASPKLERKHAEQRRCCRAVAGFDVAVGLLAALHAIEEVAHVVRRPRGVELRILLDRDDTPLRERE